MPAQTPDDWRSEVHRAWGTVCWRFWHQAGMHEPAEAEFVLDESVHDTPRHFAGCSEDGRTVFVAPSLARLPWPAVLGVLAHEAGHVVDLRNPGRYGIRKGRLHVYRGAMRRTRSDYEVELVADKLAEIGMGRPVGYVDMPDGAGLVEWFGGGIPRPKELR